MELCGDPIEHETDLYFGDVYDVSPLVLWATLALVYSLLF